MNTLLTDENIKLLGMVVTLVVTLWPFAASFLAERQAARIEAVAAKAVKFAEMYCRNNPGTDKYSLALNEALRMGKRHRVNLRVDDWAPYLEEAVFDLKAAGAELPPKQVERQMTPQAERHQNTISLR